MNRTPNRPRTGSDLGLTGEWANAPIIASYSRADALEDGELVDVTEWGSAEKGFAGGYHCPVAMTRALWGLIEVKPSDRTTEDTRGRAHDVLFLSSLALKGSLRQNVAAAHFRVRIGGRYCDLRVVADGDGVTIGLPEDF